MGILRNGKADLAQIDSVRACPTTLPEVERELPIGRPVGTNLAAGVRSIVQLPRVGFEQSAAPGVLRELRRRNPVTDDGQRKNKHHQLLTRDIGHPKLREHLAGVTTVLKIVRAQDGNWSDFIELLNKTHPPYIEMPLFDHSEDDPAD